MTITIVAIIAAAAGYFIGASSMRNRCVQALTDRDEKLAELAAKIIGE